MRDPAVDALPAALVGLRPRRRVGDGGCPRAEHRKGGTYRQVALDRAQTPLLRQAIRQSLNDFLLAWALRDRPDVKRLEIVFADDPAK